MAGLGVTSLVRERSAGAIATLVAAGAVYAWWALTDEFPTQFVGFTPHVTTLLVLVFASQRLRPPAADGVVYRRGQGR